MAEIFVSHAGADEDLVKKLVSFMKEAIGVPAKSIFCSSIEGHDIPFTENFNDYMKNKLQNPKLVIALMTPRYMESWFCMMELGAAWSKFHKTLPIVVPPVSFSDVSKTLGLTQGWNITDETKVLKLRQTIHELEIPLEKRTDQDWETKRTLFGADVKRLVKKLPGSTAISAEQYAEIEEKLQKAEAERTIFENQYQEAQSQIEELELAKDKIDVKTIRKKYNKADPSEELNELIGKVSEIQPRFMSKSFFINAVIMDYFDSAIDIDFMDYDQKNMAQQAIASKYLSDDPGNAPTWGKKLKPLGKALKEVAFFMDSDAAEQLDETLPTDCTDRDFWEYHL